jgi:hypothetical protein
MNANPSATPKLTEIRIQLPFKELKGYTKYQQGSLNNETYIVGVINDMRAP